MKKWTDLIKIARKAKEIVIISPYIKNAMLKEIIQNLKNCSNISCITKLDPRDIALGVSDLEIVDTLKSIKGKVYRCKNLHAKFYRFDGYCFWGSANLTHAAFYKNIEI